LIDYIDLQVAALILGIISAKDSGAHIISLYYLHIWVSLSYYTLWLCSHRPFIEYRML